MGSGGGGCEVWQVAWQALLRSWQPSPLTGSCHLPAWPKAATAMTAGVSAMATFNQWPTISRSGADWGWAALGKAWEPGAAGRPV